MASEPITEKNIAAEKAAPPAWATWLARPGLNLRPAGWLFLAISLLAAVEAFGFFRRNLLFLWPGLLLAAGLAAAGLTVRAALAEGHSLRKPLRMLNDAELRPEWALALLALAGGLGEVLRVAGALPALMSFLWPACLLAFGVLLMSPSVAGGGGGPSSADSTGRSRSKIPVAERRGLAALLILSGLMRALEAVFGVQPGAIGTGWFVVLLLAAIQILRANGQR